MLRRRDLWVKIILACALGAVAWYRAGTFPAQPLKAVKLTVTNESGTEVWLYWLKDGEAIYYQTLQPRQTYILNTFESHRWWAVVHGRKVSHEFATPGQDATWSIRAAGGRPFTPEDWQREKASGIFVIAGELTRADPLDRERKASYFKVHELDLQAGEIYVLDLRSAAFDTFLRLEDGTGRKISENDDISPTDLNSRLGFVPKKTGKYRAVVTSFVGGKTGPYYLQVTSLRRAGQPIVFEGKLSENSPLSAGRRFETHKKNFRAGEFWLVDLVSKDFDPALVVKNSQGRIVASDDDSGEGFNARLVLAAEGGDHLLIATSPDAGAKGAYALRLTPLEKYAGIPVARETLERPPPLPASCSLRLSDDFKLDSLKNYKVQGDVRHQPGMIHIPAGAALVRPVKAGPLVDLSLELEFTPLLKNGDASETWVAFEPQGLDQFGVASLAAGEPMLAVFRRVRKADKIVGEIRIHTTKSLAEITRVANPGRLIRTSSWSQDAGTQSLKLRYRHGLLSVYGPEGRLAAGYTLNYCANIKAVAVHQRAGEVNCRLFKIEGEPEPRLPSASERVSLFFAITADFEAEGLRNAGRYAQAAEQGRNSLQICEKILGTGHFYTQRARSTLAESYFEMGDHAACLRLEVRAVQTRREILGDWHPDLAMSLNSLGSLYKSQGDHAKAESLFLQALEICRQTLAEDDTDLAAVANNLACFYDEQGYGAKGEVLLKEAMDINRRAFGENHPAYATNLCNLGYNFLGQGKLAKAEPLLKQALEIRRRSLGAKHPRYAESVYALGTLYVQQNDAPKAEPLLKEALEIREATLGPNHPTLAPVLNELAILYRNKNPDIAEPWSRRAVEIMRRLLEESAHVQSERQQLAHRDVADYYLQTHLSVTARLPQAAASTYDLLLSWKGAVTARQRLTRVARSELAGDADAKKLFDELDSLSRQISAWTSASPDRLPKGLDLPRKLAELGAQREQTESKLASRTEAFRRIKQGQKLTAADLQKQLPEGAVLIDYVGYQNQLAAFVLTKDKLERFELGEVAPVAEAANRFRLAIKRAAPSAGKDDPARFLREKLLDPLQTYLAKANLLLIAPDGPLHSLPFAALPGKQNGKYLLEEVPVAVIPVPQLLPELLAQRGARQAEPSMMALGDVDFDGNPVQVADAKGQADWKRARAGEPMKWERLPGTKGEVLAIEAAFRKAFPKGKLTLLRDGAPTETAVRKLAPEHEFLHFATHGFFAPKEVKSALQRNISAQARLLGAERMVSGHHPGLLSGIVLAGANRPKDEDDGVLTALEVSELDLTKVELAVLSACETGLGESAGGEGVLGLQRAFQIAGARTVLTTLWSIPDEPTRVLMERFYANRLAKKMPALEALREAQQWMLNEGRSHADVQRGIQRLEKTPQPVAGGRLPAYYWAAFVLSGDWR